MSYIPTERPNTLTTTPIRVDVYRNLHTGTLSVRHRGKVLHHPRAVLLANCTFVVQPAGRARVLRDQRKNVHAFVRGELQIDPPDPLPEFTGAASYNPYKAGWFYDVDTDQPVHTADYAFVTTDGVRYT
jgi:hypothetical protein